MDNITATRYLDHLTVRAKPSSVLRARVSFGNIARAKALGHAESVDEYVRCRRGEGAKDSTINAELRSWRAAYRFSGITIPVKLLVEVRKIPTIISKDDETRLLFRENDYRVRMAMLLALHAGLRHQEIRHLRPMDVDKNRRQLSVKAWGGWSPKSHHERIIPINLTLFQELAWVFSAEDRTSPFCNRDLFAPVRTAFENAGLRGEEGGREGLHMLRRTFASRLLEQGADINTVRELMGHADLLTTQKYLVSSDKQKRSAVALLEG